MDDPLRTARGILTGCAAGAACWILLLSIAAIIYFDLHV